jgi:exopolysaccharide biosynthesis polyprenyl glycosylphosphotransferase
MSTAQRFAWLDGVSTVAMCAAALTLLPVNGTTASWGVAVRIAIVTAVCIVAFYYNDLYDFRIVRSFRGFAARLLQAFGVAFVFLAGFYALFPDTGLMEGPFVSSLATVVGLLVPLRAASYAFMRSRRLRDDVLIVGASTLASRIVDEIEAHPGFRWNVVGLVDDGPILDRLAARYPLLGPLGQLAKVIHEVEPQRVILTLVERRGRLPVADLVEARLRGCVIEDGIETFERLSGKLAIETLRPSTIVFAPDTGRYQLDLALARGASLLVSAVGLLLTAPLLGILALAIKLDSAGPVCFRHERIGLRGRPFQLLKFRTMHPATGQPSEWVRDNESRITRVGAWIRRFRLDELPQFWNILRGEMNLVGPRPHPVTNGALFRSAIPYYDLRSLVRPGVTGWAQVRLGYANSLEEEVEKMRYDLFYIKHLSPWLDLRILVDTVKTVLFGRGARATDAYPGAATAPSGDAASARPTQPASLTPATGSTVER